MQFSPCNDSIFMRPLQWFCKALAMASQWHFTAIEVIDQKNGIDIAMVMRPLHCPCDNFPLAWNYCIGFARPLLRIMKPLLLSSVTMLYQCTVLWLIKVLSKNASYRCFSMVLQSRKAMVLSSHRWLRNSHKAIAIALLHFAFQGLH